MRDDYLARAEECAARAQKTSNPDNKQHWLDAAKQWRALAAAPEPPATASM